MDKVVVVTGASGGIGAELAKQLAARGARVVLAARRQDRLDALVQEIGAQALAVVTDVTKRSDVERLAKAAIAHFGRIDVWVNNAGRGISRGVADLSDEDLDAMWNINMKNAVVVRGENDGELEALTCWSWERGITPRFLEIMAIGEGAKIMDLVFPWTEMRASLGALVEDGEPVREADRGPARYLRAKGDPGKRVGFISGTSDTYCKGCDRLRVASDGTSAFASVEYIASPSGTCGPASGAQATGGASPSGAVTLCCL